MSKRTKIKKAELHTHLGASVDPPILWSIAHRQGIKLPTKNYWEFEDMITVSGAEKNLSLDEMHNRFYHWTELIQSSPEAVEESVQSVIGGGYRKCNLVLQELRFNPMFRNRGGERDLDHIIMSALWGLEKSLLEYPEVKAGIILMMDRTLTFEQNSIILKKAIRYRGQGIVGVDIAGPQRKTFSLKKHVSLFRAAREAGLGVTLHTGEEGTLQELRSVIKEIRPDRIGHGIIACRDPKILQELAEQGIVLELCPTSNLRNNKIKNIAELKHIFSTFLKHGVKFTINTDGPEMYCTNIYKEQQFLIQKNILTEAQVRQCTKWAFESTFIK